MKLNALNNFSCLKEHCIQHCCIEWSVNIDSATLERWNNQKKHVRMALHGFANQKATTPENNWLMAKSSDGNCAALDENGHCSIQSLFGESLQPDGCRAFPRQAEYFAMQTINTATLACPEIARLIGEYGIHNLFSEDMDFNNDRFLKLSDKEQIFYKLYVFIKKIMRSPDLTLSLKLYLITSSTGDLINMLEDTHYGRQHFPDIIKKCLPDADIKSTSRPSAACDRALLDSEAFLLYWQAALEIIVQRNIRFKDLHIEKSAIYSILKSSSYSNQSKKTKKLKKMLSVNWDDHKVARQIEGLLQNYILITYINHGFPFNPRHDNLLLSLAYCNITFAISTIILVALYQQNKTITITHVINTIWQVERILKDADDIYTFIAENPILFDPDEYSTCIRYLFVGANPN